MILFYRDFQDFQLDLRHRRTLAPAAISADQVAPPLNQPSTTADPDVSVRPIVCLKDPETRVDLPLPSPPLRGFAGPHRHECLTSRMHGNRASAYGPQQSTASIRPRPLSTLTAFKLNLKRSLRATGGVETAAPNQAPFTQKNCPFGAPVSRGGGDEAIVFECSAPRDRRANAAPPPTRMCALIERKMS